MPTTTILGLLFRHATNWDAATASWVGGTPIIGPVEPVSITVDDDGISLDSVYAVIGNGCTNVQPMIVDLSLTADLLVDGEAELRNPPPPPNRQWAFRYAAGAIAPAQYSILGNVLLLGRTDDGHYRTPTVLEALRAIALAGQLDDGLRVCVQHSPLDYVNSLRAQGFGDCALSSQPGFDEGLREANAAPATKVQA